MIYLAIATITPRLERCALDAIERTTPEPHRVLVERGRSHGENLDAAFSRLPPDAEWFLTMDDDAAPLKVGWLTWLLKRRAESMLDAALFGVNRAVGALYRVTAIRNQRFAHGKNPGDQFRVSTHIIPRSTDAPWWLRNCEAYRDDDGELVFAHLGGGTIGHTWHLGARLYPRIPTWLWPIMVDRHLNAVGAGRNRADKYRRPCARCGRMIYYYAESPVICVGCETPTEQRAHLAQMERARTLQARVDA